MTQEARSLRNRRQMVQLSAASLAAFGLGKNLAAQESTPVDGEWSFTDDKGETVTLPARPERLAIDVNAAAPLWDFGIRPTALFGWNVMADGTLAAAGGNIDLEGIAIVGDVNEPVKIEDLIAAEPELIITITTALDNNPDDYWSVDASLLEQVKSVAPIIAITTTGAANEAGARDADMNTGRFAELAAALGADLESDEITAAQTEYEEAKANLEAVIAEKSDLTAVFVSTGEDASWVAWEPAWDDLSLYGALGLNIVELESHDGWWEQISNEQALRYPSDLFFISARAAHTIEQLKESPSWSQHPAIKADQVFIWNQDFIHSYQGMTEAVNTVAEALSSSEKVTS